MLVRIECRLKCGWTDPNVKVFELSGFIAGFVEISDATFDEVLRDTKPVEF
jgi:hypothetical protein